MKTVTMTMGDALRIRKILSELGETRMSVEAIEKIIKLIDELDTVYGDYNAGMEGIYDELGERDEFGRFVMEGKSPKISYERSVEFKGRKKALESRQIVITTTIDASSVKDLELTIPEYKILRKVFT